VLSFDLFSVFRWLRMFFVGPLFIQSSSCFLVEVQVSGIQQVTPVLAPEDQIPSFPHEFFALGCQIHLNRRMQRTALMFSRVLTAGGMVIKISKCEASLLFCIGFVEKLFLHSSLLSRKFS